MLQLQRSYESQEKEKMDREEVQTNTGCANEQATTVHCTVRSVLSPIEDSPRDIVEAVSCCPLESVICGTCPVTPTSGLPWPLD